MTTQTLLIKVLLEHHLIDEKTISEVLKRLPDKRLLSYLARSKIISSQNLAHITSSSFNLPITDLSNVKCETLPLDIISPQLIIETNAIPFANHPNQLDIAIADPEDLISIDLLTFQAKKQIKVFITEHDQAERLLKKISHRFNLHSLKSITNEENSQTKLKDSTSADENEPLIRFINQILEEAVHHLVSDIHFEVYEKRCRIRFRKDGLLFETSAPPKEIAQRLVARLKIMSNLDIAEHRLPQDGRIKLLLHDNHFDIRISTCPTLYGEKVVLRILDNEQKPRDIQQIGFNPAQLQEVISAITQPQGLIIVTGPTGSGKTITLYAALQYLNHAIKNIVTVEDPIEINLPNINQTNINIKANLTYEKIVRAFLRQDPDIIMVGEIRDAQTAEIAIKAAQTGHLVLSTLHTNNAQQAFTRLQNMGIESYNILSTLRLVTAQRLLRKLCPYCRQPNLKLPKEFASLFHSTTTYQAVGCSQCYHGYQGRFAIHEVLPINESQDNIILKNNFLNLREGALNAIKNGLTSFDEAKRVIQI